jgi:hypothetical protein
VRNDELQLRESLENVRREALHEGGRVAVQIVRAGGMESRVAGVTDVDHRGNVEFDQLFVNRIPIGIGKRRIGPISARRVRIQIASNKTVFAYAALELSKRILRGYAGALWQHAGADEIIRKQTADPMDQIVAGDCPGLACRGVAKMMSHAGRARRKDCEIGAALALHPELAIADRIANLIIGDQGTLRRLCAPRMRLDLGLPPLLVLLRSRRVVTVAVDDHCAAPFASVTRKPRRQSGKQAHRWKNLLQRSSPRHGPPCQREHQIAG